MTLVMYVWELYEAGPLTFVMSLTGPISKFVARLEDLLLLSRKSTRLTHCKSTKCKTNARG